MFTGARFPDSGNGTSNPVQQLTVNVLADPGSHQQPKILHPGTSSEKPDKQEKQHQMSQVSNEYWQTVRNRLRENSLRARGPYFGAVLRRRHRLARIRWCKRVGDWDLQNWCKNVLSQIIVSEQDILDMISTLDANKAVGPDIISNKMLIAVKVQIAKPLCMLFNKSLHQNIFPTDWKLAHVIPLFKAGDKSFPSNYRPVSLLSCVSKLLEKIVFKHIFNHLQGNKLLCKFQSGFLPGCSTTHQLVELYNRILLALDSKQFTSVTFADISKAFDTVWIKGLLLKLERYGIADNLLIWLKSYLSSITQRVVIKDVLSNIGQLKAGVPQGSVLDPLLFVVFINDIADGMTGLGRLFADDISIGHIANDKDSLQDMVNLDLAYLKDWSKRWLVKFNQNKTEIMVFSTRDTQLYFNFDFEGASLRDVELHKHLGVIFSNDCKWTTHIDKLIEKSSKQLNVLRKLKFKLKRNYLEKIYLTFIRPILEYAPEV